MFKFIDHVAVHCSDLQQSVTFYHGHFGFEEFSRHDRPGGGIAYMRLGNTVLELTQKQGEPMSGMHFALEAADMDEALAHLKTRGVKMLHDARPLGARRPGEPDTTRRAVFAGPDGEMIEVRG
ncbi:MAG: catechol 2,3-dioxygenase-like lactoylglutathione lyase family enzyme [Alphaproteobacteria bacterium]|jgi:catechol 2,3-dioxygenase-like lactoylglutathione lyase family enzyme